MSHPDCYSHYIRGWPTNDGGDIIGNSLKNGWIIPQLESEEIKLGSFPLVIAEVRPDMYLDLATVVAVWEEKHITVARMHMYGVTRTPARKSKRTIEKQQARGDTLNGIEDYYSWRTFLSGSSGIYTRDILDKCIREMKSDYFSAYHSFHAEGRSIRVTGCILYIHSQTD